MLRRRRLAPAIAAAMALPALGVGLTACGGGDSEPAEPSEPPAVLLARAAANPAESAVATIQAHVSLEGSSPLAGDSSLSLHGPYRLDPETLPSFDFDLDAEVAGFGVDGKVVSTGDDAFVVFFGENYRVGPERVAETERMLESGDGIDLASWVQHPRYAGVEDVAGTDTERIEGSVNSAAVARSLFRLGQVFSNPALAGIVPDPDDTGTAAAWVAFEDDTVRRVSAQMGFLTPAPFARERGIKRGTISLDAQISSVGEEAEIEPPPGGGFQPIERLIGRLSSLAGLAL